MKNSLILFDSGSIVRTPHFIKGGGGIDFLKFGNKGGDEIFFLEREGWTKGGDCLERGGFFTFILNFHEKEEYQNDFQFV